MQKLLPNPAGRERLHAEGCRPLSNLLCLRAVLRVRENRGQDAERVLSIPAYDQRSRLRLWRFPFWNSARAEHENAMPQIGADVRGENAKMQKRPLRRRRDLIPANGPRAHEELGREHCPARRGGFKYSLRRCRKIALQQRTGSFLQRTSSERNRRIAGRDF